MGGFNIGGINATGQVTSFHHVIFPEATINLQVPSISGNWGLIDLDTPGEAYTKPSWMDPTQKMLLVFSDEFNQDGRTFYPGDDPYWEALDLHYWVS
jgi:hypothetical protein